MTKQEALDLLSELASDPIFMVNNPEAAQALELLVYDEDDGETVEAEPVADLGDGTY